MPIPDSYIQELKTRLDIVDVVSDYVTLTKKSGGNLWACCPFHGEKTPSFAVRPERQSYHCFGCGKGGGVIGFVMEIERVGFRDAVELLAKKANMPPPPSDGGDPALPGKRQRMLELNRDAARWFYEQLVSPAGKPGQDYVSRRGISMTCVKNFGLGYAPGSWESLCSAMKAGGYSEQELLDAGLAKRGRTDGIYDTFRDRLIFPVVDVRGSVVAFSGRIIGDGEPKYLNSPETLVFSKSHNLFAMNLAKKTKCGYIILTEGNIDVVSLHQAGFDSAVASLGTSLTPEQARIIGQYVPEAVLCYDGDAAGQKATRRAIELLDKAGLRVRVLELSGSGAKDPDEFIKKNGADAFRNLIEGSAGQVDYRLRQVESNYDLSTPAGRVEYLKEAERLLARLPNAVEREIYGSRVAERAGVSPTGVKTDVERIRSGFLKKAKKDEQRAAMQPARNAQPEERSLRYDDPKKARVEEELIRLLYLEPELCRRGDLPDPELFSSELLRRIYCDIVERVRSGRSTDPDVLAQNYTHEEYTHLMRIVSDEVDLSRAGQALEDYIRSFGRRAAGSGSEEEALLELAKAKREKQNGG